MDDTLVARPTGAREKRYVQVISKTDREGNITPISIVWRDGIYYDVDAILDQRRACSVKTGGTGIRYTVRIRGRVTHLFYEGPRWFVEAKIVPLP